MPDRQTQKALEDQKKRIDGLAAKISTIAPPGGPPPAVQSESGQSGPSTRTATGGLLAWIQKWGTPIALLIAFLAFLSPIYFRYSDKAQQELRNSIDLQISSALNKPGGINASIKELSTNESKDSASLAAILPIFQDLVRHELERASNLRPAALQEQLPNVRKLLVAADDAHISVPQEFWPHAAALITYRSTNAIRPTDRAAFTHLPACLDSYPKLPVVTEVGPGGSLKKLQPHQYENCTFTIDDPNDFGRFNNLIEHGIPGVGLVPTVEFKNCLIVYSGGDFRLDVRSDISGKVQAITGHGIPFDLHYNGPTLEFTNCLLRFSASSHDPTKGRGLLEALLLQDGPEFKVPASAAHS